MNQATVPDFFVAQVLLGEISPIACFDLISLANRCKPAPPADRRREDDKM
jgi:hypothetical protein